MLHTNIKRVKTKQFHLNNSFDFYPFKEEKRDIDEMKIVDEKEEPSYPKEITKIVIPHGYKRRYAMKTKVSMDKRKFGNFMITKSLHCYTKDKYNRISFSPTK